MQQKNRYNFPINFNRIQAESVRPLNRKIGNRLKTHFWRATNQIKSSQFSHFIFPLEKLLKKSITWIVCFMKNIVI
jgi:hypothetical protein